MPAVFVFFFFSGLCSVLYEIIWLRLAMAAFGVTTALTSIVLSTFMAGLGLGSWVAGILLRRHVDRIRSPLRLYALIELAIGAGGILVPLELGWGRALVERTALSSSAAYYLASGAWLALTLVPWCALMGATIPTAMLAIRRAYPGAASRSFSYLYLANVFGAFAGTIAPLVLVELLGFRSTLRAAALVNLLIALAALALSRRVSATLAAEPIAPAKATAPSRVPLLLLFMTGLTSLGLEVVWIRQFTPYLGSVVYAFAAILAIYLMATFAGSQYYRLRSGTPAAIDESPAWILLGFAALLPLFVADPQLAIPRLARPLLGIVPFSALAGFLTPMLVDRWAGGDPDQAGRAYAINVLGCIFGPLLAGFLLLPLVSERWVVALLALPWVLVGASQWRRPAQRRWIAATAAIALVAATSISRGYEAQFAHAVVLRDNTATTIATGEGFNRRLLVNGIGMTGLSPVTKTMAHLPLAFLNRAPRNALVVCFGMGTTHRALLSWGISSTAVELVPSVPRLFGYYHADAAAVAASPLSRIVIDDGRRYLERTSEQFDVITIDPPPPIEAAGSSLLMSKEFYGVVGRRLRPGGIFQMWYFQYVDGDTILRAAAIRSLRESFAYVRAFPIQRGSLQYVHFIASNQPLVDWTAAELASHMPPAAVRDLLEWGPEPTAEAEFARILSHEIPVDPMIGGLQERPVLTDNRPMNEYYVLRRLSAGGTLRSLIPRP